MTRIFANCLVGVLLGFGLTATARGADDSSSTSDAGNHVFDSAEVIKLHLSLTERQFAALAPAGRPQFGPPGFGPGVGPGVGPGIDRSRSTPPGDTHRNTFGVEFPWTRGNLEFEGRTYHDVGVRYKGNYTYMATSQSLKKSLKIDLNRNVKGQTLDGLAMLNLHCGVSDPTRARESLSYAIFRDLGVPAPHTSLVELALTVPGKYDREYVGLYTLAEQVDKRFLKRHFGQSGGMLLKPEGLAGGPSYLGSEWKPYADRYHPDDEPTAAQKQRLIDFTKLISDGDDATFEREIASYLDVDAFLRFIAANALLANLDSYLGYGHNYYLYLDPKRNQFVFIPWDLDLSLATWPAAGTPEQLVELSVRHPHSGKNPLIDRLFAIPSIRDRYLDLVKQLVATRFTKARLTELLDPIERAIADPLAREKKSVEARHEGGPARGPGGNPPGRGGFGGGPFGGGGFGNSGQFGQSMPPRRFIEKRLTAIESQLAGRTEGYIPRAFGGGGGFGGPNRPPQPR